MVSDMTNNDAYEAPTVERVGSVAEVTAAAGLVNSDDGLHANNAFSNP